MADTAVIYARVPVELHAEVTRLAEVERRTISAETEILVREALEARKARK